MVLDEIDAGDVDEVMEVTEPAKDDFSDAFEKFKKQINSMPFGNTKPSSSSKTTESSQMMTSKSAPSRKDSVLDPTIAKGTNSAPKGSVVPMDRGSIYSKINLVPPTASKHQIKSNVR